MSSSSVQTSVCLCDENTPHSIKQLQTAEISHLVLQVVNQVDVLRGFSIFRVVQQLSITRIHQVNTELHYVLYQALGDHVRKLQVLQGGKNNRSGLRKQEKSRSTVKNTEHQAQ